MKRNQSYMFRTEKNKKKKTLPIIFITLGMIVTLAMLGWLWVNDWDAEKSYDEAVNAITSLWQEKEEELVEEPDEGEVEEDDMNQNEEQNDVEHQEADTPDDEVEDQPEDVEEYVQYIEGQELPDEPTYIENILIANKKYPLPSTFAPGESKEAREAFNEMKAAAALENIHLVAFSTYRSFEYQTDLYKRYVERDGVEEADRYSARPGYSEHQTGLAFDIGEVNQEKHWASSSFADTAGGKWLAENAHKYGFIKRYPKGKEAITGYMYESWHFRYVGEEIAKDIYEDEGTLEEYLEI